MGCPFGFEQSRRETRPLEPLFYELKAKAQCIAYEIMEENGLDYMKMRDVCISTLLSYRVQNETECKNSVKLLYERCYGKFTQLLIALQNLEEYMNSVFVNNDGDEPDVYFTVMSMFGYSIFHDQEKFLERIKQ
jgi:hypothetical protein